MFIEYLKLNNFLSFVELDYTFSSTTTLINGVNLSDEGQDSNGAGKTVIQSALEKVLLDYTSRKKVRSSDLIRRGEKQSIIETSIYCPIRNERLKVLRTLNLKGSDKVELFVNEQPQSFATVNDGNNFIIDWIGISKEDISNYYIVNKHRWKSFFSSSNADKLKLIGRFSNTQSIEDAEQCIKVKIEELKGVINEKNRDYASIEGKIQLINEQIEECNEEGFEQLIQIEIDGYNKSICLCNDEIRGHEISLRILGDELQCANKEVSECNSRLSKLQDDLNSLEGTESVRGKIEEVEGEINELKPNKKLVDEKIKEDRVTVREAEKYLDTINEKLRGIITCPKCNFRFKEHSDVDVTETEHEKVEAEELHAEALREVYESQRKLDEIQAVLDKKTYVLNQLTEKESEVLKSHRLAKNKINNVRNEISDWEVEISRSERNIKDSKVKIEEAKKRLQEFAVKIEEASNRAYDDSQKLKLQEKLEEQEALLVIARKFIENKTEEVRNTEEWGIRLKDFRMYIANIGINEIQKHCNEMLGDMRSDMLVSVDGFKVLADGKIKDEITATVIRDGGIYDFGSFSNGEQGRLEYAMIIALQRMVNSTNKWGGLHFLMTDEVCEGIDGTGLLLLAKSLKGMDFPILITTHVTNQSVDVNTITVIKENNVSRLEL